MYKQWRTTMLNSTIGKRELVELIDAVRENVSNAFLDSLETRLEPYMPFYLAMELIDPTGPGVVTTEETWVHM